MVLIKFRTTDKKIHEIEMAPETLIEEAKQLFQQQVGGCEAKSMRMIYKTIILSGNTPISTLNIKENDFIVVYIPKNANQKSQSHSTQASNQAQPVSRPNPLPINTQPYSNLLPTNSSPIQPNQYVHPQQSYLFPFTPANQYNSNNLNYGQARPFRPTNVFSQIVQNSQYNDLSRNPEFHQNVEQLMDICGVCRTECESALLSSHGNVERAAEYLLNSNIALSRNRSSPNSSTVQLSSEFITTFRKMLQREPRILENFVEEFERENPAYRQNPELLLSQFGLTSEGFDVEGIRNYSVQRVEPRYFDQLLENVQNEVECPNLKTCLDQIDPNYEERKGFQSEQFLLSQFSNEEKEAIRRIQNIGNFNLNEVVQMYLACDKNEEYAANLLFSK